MSRIYFHSQTDGNAEVWGVERALMAFALNGIAVGILGVREKNDGVMRKVDPSSYLHTETGRIPLAEAFRNWFGVGDGFFMVDGKRVGTFDVALNTALAIGNDALRLAARLHGQCEIHCWVDGPNREWLASVIESALEAGIFRETLQNHPTGWREVISHLRKRDTEPVVCSYSVCESFPNGDAAGWEYDDEDENEEGKDFSDLPATERWKLAMEGLKQKPWLELRPDKFAGYRFGGGETAMTIRDKA